MLSRLSFSTGAARRSEQKRSAASAYGTRCGPWPVSLLRRKSERRARRVQGGSGAAVQRGPQRRLQREDKRAGGRAQHEAGTESARVAVASPSPSVSPFGSSSAAGDVPSAAVMRRSTSMARVCGGRAEGRGGRAAWRENEGERPFCRMAPPRSLHPGKGKTGMRSGEKGPQRRLGRLPAARARPAETA